MIKSLEELSKIRDKYSNEIDLRNSESNSSKTRIAVGTATCGIASGSRETFNAFVNEIANQKLSNVLVVQSGCMGYCYAEPTVEIREPGKEPILYGNVNSDVAKEIIKQHVIEGKPLQNHIIKKDF